MKKTDFYISSIKKDKEGKINYIIKKESGYFENFTAPNGRILTMCFDKRGSRWYITDKNSGAKLPYDFATRKEARASLTDDMLTTIVDCLEKDEIKAAAKRLKDYIDCLIEKDENVHVNYEY